MTQYELFDKAQNEAERLLRLLKNREPGLMTWNMMVCQSMKRLSELWTGEK